MRKETTDPLAAIDAALGSKIENRESRIGQVVPAAQPAVAAVLIRRHPKTTVWIVCPDARRQEEVAADFLAWGADPVLFPELEQITDTEGLADPEILSERLEILGRLATGEKLRLVLTADQLEAPVPAPDTFRRHALTLAVGQRHDVPALEATLAKDGYESVPKIFSRGQFARRGGILDVFSWQHSQPIRVEFFDEDIESIRSFHLDSQVSIENHQTCEILTGDTEKKHVPLATYQKPKDLTIHLDPENEAAEGIIITQSEIRNPKSKIEFHPPGIDVFEAGDLVINEAKRRRFFDQINEWTRAKWTVVLVCNNEGEWERFSELARDNGVDPKTLHFREGSLIAGFTCPAARLAILSDAEIFGRSASQRSRRQWIRRERAAAARGGMDYTEFEPGDLVVHLDHGIGRFEGITTNHQSPVTDHTQPAETALIIEFANDSKLYVPLDQAWQVSRYVGLGKRNPALSVLGDGKWQRAMKKAERSIFEYATTMLRLQAERDTSVGHAFGPDTQWQHEFENAFVYQPTVDQLRAIEETKLDLEAERPTDRLICGDVGFGKTEVAIRAIFKAVMGGKQAAFLAPTTVLAQQHAQTLRERMSEYPVTVESLHRFRTKAEQTATVRGLANGTVDVVVGTHRLLSEDVIFKDLGLVVVDEEQRFGVRHKEILKDRFRLIDVLTLSATPIPRTLYLALMGARDMSLIETPPPNRQPVETTICAYDERIMRDAIVRELKRGGQVYLLHNRVRTIDKLAARIVELVPHARVAVGHGQMGEHELEPIMRSFIAGDIDVLVSTTIIESGLDIPNANTILIDRADRFGLADLYQLRGRVGRSHHKAYAYLLLPRELMTATGDARKRVQAIKQYSELGAGFKIAMRDLEIRGAGNILGTAQSGHILAVGFDLYCKMLKRSVATLQGTKSGSATLATARLDFVATSESEFLADPPPKATTSPTNHQSPVTNHVTKLPAFLPTRFITEPHARIEAYRKLADAPDRPGLSALRAEWADRYGPPPPAVDHLLTLHHIRFAAATARIRSVETRDDKLMLMPKGQSGDYVLFGKKFPRLTSTTPENKLREVLTFLEKRLSA